MIFSSVLVVPIYFGAPDILDSVLVEVAKLKCRQGNNEETGNCDGGKVLDKSHEMQKKTAKVDRQVEIPLGDLDFC
ncbi:hypothetical protein BPOR_0099g00160 [Botrytis porri]|uniref:Uncharacterized protein n=1 Tax=Botrytis porri TaxID=87229 RepID=A0A4Z1KYS0_9HELO|nr:hypothetical protein BPOR_0099g00160 [Botrytis porri]